jgi:hypothetical protein
MATTITDVLGYIAGSATDDELERVLHAYKTRRKMLQQVRAASVTVGASVTLDGLSPKALNGLTGTVASIDGNRASVELDADSTTRLAFTNTRFAQRAMSKHNVGGTYTVPGIPMGCLK